MAIQEFRELLGISPHQVHLNNAGLAPMTMAAQRAINEMSSLLVTDAFHSVERIIAQYERARSSFSALVGAEGLLSFREVERVLALRERVVEGVLS